MGARFTHRRAILFNYINYLRQFDKKVYSNKEDGRTHGRKYLGIVFTIGENK